MTMENSATALRSVVMDCEAVWHTRPFVVLACAGYSDEHWQVYHPDFLEMPVYTIDTTGSIELHPDAPKNVKRP